MEDRKKIVATIVIVAVLFILLYFFSPLLDGIVLGVVFAYIVQPIKKWMEKRLSRRSASLIATLLIVVPLLALLILGLMEGIAQASLLSENVAFVQRRFGEIMGGLSLTQSQITTVSNLLSRFGSSFLDILKGLPILHYATALVMLVLNGFIAVVACYYFLADGNRLYKSMKRIFSERTMAVIDRSNKRVGEMLVGNFYAAFIISLISIPFLLYFRVPFWIIAVGFMFLAAMIPIFAEWMVLLPVSLYVLLATDVTTFAIFLGVGLVFVYLIPEFVLRPVLVGKLSNTHPLLLLLAFVGGGIVFGISGFFLAPIAVCVALAIYEDYTLHKEEDMR